MKPVTIATAVASATVMAQTADLPVGAVEFGSEADKSGVTRDVIRGWVTVYNVAAAVKDAASIYHPDYSWTQRCPGMTNFWSVGSGTTIDLTDTEKVAPEGSAADVFLKGSDFTINTLKDDNGNVVVGTKTCVHMGWLTYTHNYVTDVIVEYGVVDYIMNGEREFKGALAMATDLLGKQKASSITIGAAEAGILTATSVDLAAYNDITVANGSSITATRGAIALSSDANVSVEGNVTAQDGDVTLKASGASTVSGGASVIASADVTLSGETASITGTGTTVEATNGNLALNGTEGNTISGTVVAGNGVNMTVQKWSLTTVGSNTISGNVTARNGDIVLVSRNENEHGLSGSNKIYGSAIAEKGQVKLDSMFNTIEGSTVEGSTANVAGATGVTVGTAGTTLTNTISGGQVTAGTAVTGGDIELTGMLNTVNNGAVLTSNGGSITLSGVKAGILQIPGVGELLNSLLGGNSLDITLNSISGENTTLAAGKSVNLNAQLNLLTGGTVQGGLNFVPTAGNSEKPAVSISGDINALFGSSVSAGHGDITMIATGNGGLVGSLLGMLGGSLGDSEIVATLLDGTGAANIIGGENSSLAANKGSVLMDGRYNLMLGGAVSASDTVTLGGAVNAITGGSITGGNVIFQASANPDNTIAIGDIIGNLIDSFGQTSGENTGAEGSQTTDLGFISGLLSGLDGLTGNTNMVTGDGTTITATAGNVTLDGMLNLVTGGAVLSETGTVELQGAINMVAGGEVQGVDVIFTASENANNTIDLSKIIGALTGSGSETAGQPSELPDSGTEDTTSPETHTAINLISGGSVTADNNVDLDAALNMVMGGTVSAGNAITLNGTINAATGGSITGSSVLFQSTEKNTIDLGGALSTVLGGLTGGSANQDGGETVQPEAGSDIFNGLLENLKIDGNINMVAGKAEVISTAGNVTMDGTLNLMTGGTVNANDTALLKGAINAVTGGTLTGNSVSMQGGSELGLGGVIGSLLENTGLENLPTDQLNGNLNLIAGGNVGDEDTTLVDMTGTVNVVTGGTVNAGGNVSMTGTLNLVAGGNVNASTLVTLAGPANVVTGGTITGNTIQLQNNGDTSMSLGSLISGLLPSETPEDFFSVLNALNGNLNLISGGYVGDEDTTLVDMTGTVNVVTGGTVNAGGNVNMTGTLNLVAGGNVNSATLVTMNGPVNVVTGTGSITGHTIAMQGDKGVLNMGDVVSGLLAGTGLDDQFGALLDSVTGNVNIVTGKNAQVGDADTTLVTMDGMANVVAGGGTVSAGGKVNMTGKLNLITGGNVSSLNSNVTLSGPANVVMGGAQMSAGDTLTLKGAGADGLALGALVTIPDEYKEYADQIGLTQLLNKDINANVVTGEGTNLTAGTINASATANVMADGAVLEAGDSITLKGIANLVIDGASMSAANDVNMQGSGSPILKLDSLTLEQCAEIAVKLGVKDALKDMKAEGIAKLLEYAETNDLTELLAVAKALGVDDLLTEMSEKGMAELLSFIEDHASAKLPGVELDANVNVLATGASVHAGNNVNMNGSLNLVTDGASVTAGNAVNMNGIANVVAGGALVGDELTPDVVLNGGLNLVVDTTIDNVKDAIESGSLESIMTGGSVTTTISALNDVTLNGTINLVNGGKVALNAGNAVNMNGSLNIVSGMAQVHGGSAVNMGGLVNVVGGGATVSAGSATQSGDINLDGSLNLIVDTTLTNVMDALQQQNLTPLMQGGTNVTSLQATGNITMNAMANVVNGGKVALNAGNAVTLNALTNIVSGKAQIHGGSAVNLDALVNVVGGGATVSAGSDTQAGDINLDGELNLIVDTTLTNVVDALQQQSLNPLMQGGSHTTTLQAAGNINLGATVNVVNGGKVALNAGNAVNMNALTNIVSGKAQIHGGSAVNLDALINVVGGGATVSAGSDTQAGDINLDGELNLIVDTTLTNVVDALQQQSLNPLMQGGSNTTTLQAAGNINLGATVNAVNGGKVALNAGNAVNMNGVANVIAGGAAVHGDQAVNIDGLANVVAGGTTVSAGNATTAGDITMTGGVNAIVDTTLTNVLDALKQQSLGPIVQGGDDDTTLTATGNVNLEAQLNIVNGGQVAVNAGKSVNMTGDLNVAGGNAQVTAGDSITMTGAANLVANGADLTAGSITMTGSGAVNDALAGLIDSVAQNSTVANRLNTLLSQSNTNVVAGEGTTLTATNGSIEMSGAANVVTDGATLNGTNIKLTSADSQGLLISGLIPADIEQKLRALGAGDLLDSNTNINANIIDNGAALNATNNATLSASANVINGADITAGNDVNLHSSLNVVNNTDIVATEGDISFSGGEGQKNITVITNSNLQAEKGHVSFTNVNAGVANGSITAGKGMSVENADVVLHNVTVTGGDTTIASNATASIEQLISSNSLVMNSGSLTLNDATISGSTLYNAGSMDVNGSLTLQEASLVYVAESLTSNSTAISLGGVGALNSVNVFALENLGDAISSICFVLPQEVLADIVHNEKGFSLTLFTGASEVDWQLVFDAVQEGEISFSNGKSTMNTAMSNTSVQYINGDIVITGNVAVVPEPTTATLSLLALAALAARRRRRAA